MEIKFGKWKGFTVQDVDDGYLEWLMSKPDTPIRLVQAAQAEIARRRKTLDKRFSHAVRR